jgi:hypothetical protein
VRPKTLRFFCEVDEGALAPLLTPRVLAGLRALGAGVTLGLRDLSAERARAVARLVDAGVPVGAWVLLPRAQGYFATPRNVTAVSARCDEVLRWVDAHALKVEALGLDLEPDLDELDALFRRPVRTLARWATRRTPPKAGLDAAHAYAQLVARLRGLGHRVESYVFPLVLDDRRRGHARWQRFAGLVDVRTEREVVMLYSSLLGPIGAGVVASYARWGGARAIAVGSTGGGIDPLPKLTLEALSRDLRLAAAACDDVSVFSLEGCVERGLLEPLASFDWDAPVHVPRGRWVVDAARRALG